MSSKMPPADREGSRESDRQNPTQQLGEIRRTLRDLADPVGAKAVSRYFKTGPGEYGEGDRFLGIAMPHIRRLARQHPKLPLDLVVVLLTSADHEERMLGLLILIDQYSRGGVSVKDLIHQMYLDHMRYVNNWDLVDVTAEHLIGAHIDPTKSDLLDTLSTSDSVWERRMAILATRYWIRKGQFAPTFRIAERLLEDEHDLIHKAVGWMLREVGKLDQTAEEAFLRVHYHRMPRTMLRYAIEHFPEPKRKAYLGGEM